MSTADPTTPPPSGNVELAHQFVEVRRAYRLVHAYQRRLLDLLRVVGDRVRGAHPALKFGMWVPVGYSAPPRSDVDPTRDKWAWDFLPLYRFQLDWRTDDKPESGALLVGLRHEADTGYGTTGPGEPDALKFHEESPPTALFSTTLRAYVIAIGDGDPQAASWGEVSATLREKGEVRQLTEDGEAAKVGRIGAALACTESFTVQAEWLATPEKAGELLVTPLLEMIADVRAAVRDGAEPAAKKVAAEVAAAPKPG